MTSNIKEATVYLRGAQVTRNERFKLGKGTSSVKFRNLPLSMNPQSIMVAAENDAVVLSVSHSNTYSLSDDTKRISDLMKKLEKLQKSLAKENDAIEMLYFEEELLKNNSKMDGGKIFRASDVKETVLFFRERMMGISADRSSAEERMQKLNEEISSIQSEIGMDSASRRRSEVTVEVFSEKETEAELKLSYFTYDASWSPYYDIRAKDVESPVIVQSKATVYQHTGEDWKDVSLTLSTGNPSLSGDVPDLRPWYLDFHAPAPRAEVQLFNAQVSSRKISEAMLSEESDMKVDHYERAAQAPVENLTSVEYVLKAPYSIESSGNGRSVDINSNELPAEYVYKSVRKLEKDVFLVAEIKEWEKLNLIEGNASIFFEGKYVGSTHIDPRRAEESLVVSLGRDKNVIVTRIRGKDFTSRSALGSTVKASREWELTARNVKKQKITIIMEDQIPVSVNKSITVDAVSVSGANHDKETGKLEWKFDLEPAASRSFSVKYEVSYPKSGTIVLE